MMNQTVDKINKTLADLQDQLQSLQIELHSGVVARNEEIKKRKRLYGALVAQIAKLKPIQEKVTFANQLAVKLTKNPSTS